MPRAALLVTFLVLVAAAGVGVGGTDVATAGSGSPGDVATASAPHASLATDGASPTLQGSFDRTIVKIRVDADGSARWTFRYERILETDEEREDFAAYAEEFNENETDLYESFRADATGLVAEGSNVTGRDMAAKDFSRHAEIGSSLGNDVGIVELSFTWEAFAEADGDRVVVGDVFEGGLYIGPDQELVFVAGDGLVFESVAPNATQSNPESLRDSETVTWTGEREFTDQRPRVVLGPKSAGTATATESGAGTTARTTTATDTTAGSDGGRNWFPLVAVVVLFSVGAIWYRERSPAASSPLAAVDPRGSDGDGTATVGDDGTATPAAQDGGTGTGSVPDVDGDTDTVGADAGTAAGAEAGAAAGAEAGAAAGTAGAGSGAGSSAGGEPGTEPAVPDEAFLSDEDRVRKLLRENGGRMKQVRIVEETDWSKSKVSVLLSEMEEEGVVSKLRVGRENVVSLDGHEPEAARSPFEDVDGDDDA